MNREQTSSRFRRARCALLCGLFVMGLLGSASVRAEDPADREYPLKAGFIYNFMQFIEWPEESFIESGGALVLGVYGDDPFGGYLDQLQNRDVQGHPVRVVHLRNLSELPGCHMLFVPEMEEGAMKEMFANLPSPAPVTVGEQAGFAAMGGTINLFLAEKKQLKFEVNMQSAHASGVKISSRLLRLAVLVAPGDQGFLRRPGESCYAVVWR